MTNNNHINRVNLGDFQPCCPDRLNEILSKVEKSGRPFIITKHDKGVAAILPYIDPADTEKIKQKCNSSAANKKRVIPNEGRNLLL